MTLNERSGVGGWGEWGLERARNEMKKRGGKKEKKASVSRAGDRLSGRKERCGSM